MLTSERRLRIITEASSVFKCCSFFGRRASAEATKCRLNERIVPSKPGFRIVTRL